MTVKKTHTIESGAIVNELVIQIKKNPTLEMLLLIDDFMLVAKSEKISINIVNNNSIFQPVETVKNKQICGLHIIFIGKKNIPKTIPDPFKRLLEMQCPLKTIRMINNVPYLINELLNEG